MKRSASRRQAAPANATNLIVCRGRSPLSSLSFLRGLLAGVEGAGLASWREVAARNSEATERAADAAKAVRSCYEAAAEALGRAGRWEQAYQVRESGPFSPPLFLNFVTSFYLPPAAGAGQGLYQKQARAHASPFCFLASSEHGKTSSLGLTVLFSHLQERWCAFQFCSPEEHGTAPHRLRINRRHELGLGESVGAYSLAREGRACRCLPYPGSSQPYTPCRA